MVAFVSLVGRRTLVGRGPSDVFLSVLRTISIDPVAVEVEVETAISVFESHSPILPWLREAQAIQEGSVPTLGAVPRYRAQR